MELINPFETERPESTINLFHKKRVLIVDDFENFRLSLKKMLQQIGCGVIDVMQDAKLALSACSRQPYDIIICDFNLGEGKNGQQFLEELRHLDLLNITNIFIIITAETSKEIVMGTLECQPDAYLSKPINQALLKKRLEKIIKQTNTLTPLMKLIHKKKYSEAMDVCQQGIISGGRLVALYQKQLAELLIITKQYEEAKILCNNILDERKVDWPYQMLGRIESILGNSKESIKNYENLIKINPNSVAAYDEMAEVYLSQGTIEKAQDIIQQAVKISPLAILRQQKLGKVSRENGSLDIAVKAFKRTVELGEHSCFDSVDNYIDLATSLVDLAEEDENANLSTAIHESEKLFKKINKRFSPENNTKIKINLVKAKSSFGEGDKQKTEEILDIVESIYTEDKENLSIDTLFEIGKTFFSCDRIETAETILFQLMEDFSDDKRLVNKVIAFLDEPISQKNRNEAAAANREGITLYEQKSYQEAIDKFQQALKLSPRNPGLNLNLIQACLYLLQENFNVRLLELCEDSLVNVKHLRDNHPQYKRYEKLMKPVQKWRKKVSK